VHHTGRFCSSRRSFLIYFLLISLERAISSFCTAAGRDSLGGRRVHPHTGTSSRASSAPRGSSRSRRGTWGPRRHRIGPLTRSCSCRSTSGNCLHTRLKSDESIT
uniref:Uncharacterized protein n=1 Tax=Aegilops tauschii subsp. strangulata TaxID=200361 RepID=A0A453M7U9_AEGTS